MLWKKLGQLYCPKPIHPKLVSHAANPLAVFLEGNIYRIFFSGRDVQNRSSVGFVDVDIEIQKVTYVHDKPIFEYGPENSFYSHGVSIGNLYETNGKRYVLFMGWQHSLGTHWRGDIGRLILGADNLSLQLESSQPFLGIDKTDPISLSYPWVHQDEHGKFKMWYGSTITWNIGNGEMLHVINHASSDNGHDWHRKGLAVPFEIGLAQAFSRPSIIKQAHGNYQMWFSYRSGAGEKYRIGYASSPDGSVWNLELEKCGIHVSKSGWDSEMIEYPFVFNHKGRYFMLYNGNDNGKTGFGLAILDG